MPEVQADENAAAASNAATSDVLDVKNDALPQANGVAHEADVDHKKPAANGSAKEADASEPPEPAEWQTRMWFVKTPKPPEDSSLLVLEQEQEAYRTQLSMLAELMKLERTKKDAVEANRKAAAATLQKCRHALSEKDEEMKPIQALRERRQTLLDTLAAYRDLTVKTEAELDTTVADLERRMAQESLTLNEEKQLQQTVKKLKSQRERVKDYVAKSAELVTVREEIKAAEAALDSVQSDRKALLQELEIAKAIKAKYAQEEQVLRDNMDDLGKQRQAIKEQRDAAWERLMERKTPKQAKAADFYDNRKFSREVRELLSAGNISEARTRCAAQVDEFIDKLSTDDSYRADYVKMFDLQRPRKFMLEDDEEDVPAAAARGGKGKGGADKAAQQPVNIDPEAAKKRAEALIAATLAQAKSEAAAVTAATAATPEATAAAVPAVAAAAPLAAPAPVAAKKPTKSKPAVVKEALLPEALVAEDKFELPAYIQESKKEAEAVPKQAQLTREERAAAAAEAAARKEKRKQQAARRKAEREAAEAATRAAKQEGAATVPGTTALAADTSGADDTADEGAAMEAAPTTVNLNQAVRRSNRPGGKNATAKANALARARPRRQGKSDWLQYWPYAAAVVAILVALGAYVIMS